MVVRVQSPQLAKAPHRVASLDGMRALAIAAVVCLHFNWGGLLGGGQAGVTVFFVISGYLITAGLIRQRQRDGKVNLRNFYTRRFWRLGPALGIALIAGLLGSLVLTAVGLGSAARPDEYLATAGLVLAQVLNIAAASGHGVSYELMPTWSLAVEEQFYLVWAAAMLLLTMRRKLTAALCAALLAAGASFAWSWWLALAGAPKDRLAYAPDTQAGSLFLGAALAILLAIPAVQGWLTWSRMRLVLGWSAGLITIACLINHPFDLPLYEWGQVLLAMASAVCVGLLVTARPDRRSLGQRLLSLPPLVWIGTMSYGIYLFHVMIMQWLGGPGGWQRNVLALALTLLAAAACYRYVEQPVLRWADRKRAGLPAGVVGVSHFARSPLTKQNDISVAGRSLTRVPAKT